MITLQPGESIIIEAAAQERAKTPLTFTESQVRRLITIAGQLDQTDGSMAALLTAAAASNREKEFADQDVIKCAAGGCILGSRYLEYVAYAMLAGNPWDGFEVWYPKAIASGMFGARGGMWNWQLDETKVYDFLPWSDLNNVIINNYAVHCKPNWIDGKQYREWRRFCVVDGERIPQYKTDEIIIMAARNWMPSVICFRDGPDKSGGTHTSCAVLYESTDGKHYHVMLDTAHPDYRGGVLTASEDDHERARESPVPSRRRGSAGPRRFGPGAPRWLFNCYTHVIASSVLMRAFAGQCGILRERIMKIEELSEKLNHEIRKCDEALKIIREAESKSKETRTLQEDLMLKQMDAGRIEAQRAAFDLVTEWMDFT